MTRPLRSVLLPVAVLACALAGVQPCQAADATAPATPGQATAATVSPAEQQLIGSWIALIGDGKPDLAAVTTQLEAHPELAQAWSTADASQPWNVPCTALHVAIGANNRALAALLIDHHAPLDAEGRWCTSPLMWSDPTTGAWLIGKGAQPTIFWYAHANDLEHLNAALAKQPELAKAGDRQHRTALSWAVERCAAQAAGVLITAGADVDAVDDCDCSVLTSAIGWDDQASRNPERQQLVDHLIHAGAHWDARAAAMHGKLAELTQAIDQHPELLKKHYATDAGDGSMLIHYACLGNHQDCVELLLKRGMDINATDDAGTSPLHSACVHGSTLVSWLIAHGANASLHEKHYGSDAKGWAQYFGNKDALAAFDAVAAAAKQAAKAKAAEKSTANF